MQEIIECVPNFSDGRNPEVYTAIADAIQSVPEVQLLDVSADPLHNRTVITFVGSPSGVEEAAYQAIKTAAKLINLDNHQGEHPRIGATDVFPFIPIRGVTRRDCVQLAHRVGKRVGDELGVAVYMYGFAATTKKNNKINDIRSGEYEQWKQEVGKKESRNPDYGPAQPATWGATAIGVRPFLIAYNVYLNTEDVEIARQIARNIREMSGGLRHVQAKGFLVDGQAQINMNILNFEHTPLYRVQELIRSEANYFGLKITRGEIVGLTPQKALMDSAKWYHQIHDMRDEQVLEYRLRDWTGIQIGDFTPDRFLEATAANTPTPGGGSAAALVGALAASLTQMVAGLTMGRDAYSAVQAEANAVLDDAMDLRQQLTNAIVEDSDAFEEFLRVRRQFGKEDQALEKAILRIVEIPLKVAYLSRDVVLLANSIAEIGNKNAATDAATAAILARAAVQTAVLNVRANAKSLPDDARSMKWKAEVESLNKQVNELVESVIAIAARRGGY
ncbi:MAG: glutamate formimidoyltransferase [Chloroflexota bacterium]